MSKLLAFFLVLMSSIAVAQQNHGIAKYEQTIKLNIELPPEMEAYAAMMPKEQKQKMVLLFDGAESIFKNVVNKEVEMNEMNDEDERIMVKIDGQGTESVRYMNTQDSDQIVSQTSLGKTFLIKSKLLQTNWKFTGEQEQILDYTCMKAVSERDSQKMVAWFAPQIPVSSGPHGSFGLPGLILKLELRDGEMVYEAKEVSFQKPSDDDMKKPKKGKKVTQAEYDKIMAERVAEMQKMHGGKGHFIIKTEIEER